MDYGHYEIKGVAYTAFSCLKASEGGMSKADAIAMLKERGIKVSTTNAYTPYVGHYALWVETKREDEASKLLFGS
jgi:hypothetical protein